MLRYMDRIVSIMPTYGALDEPDLLPQHAYRALLYVEKLNNVGVNPRAEDVEAFAVSDQPRDARYRSSFMPELTTFQTTKIAKAEPVIDWLVRMRWLTIDEGRLSISDLGAALIAALRASPSEWSQEREGAGAVVLRPDDPFVYSELTRAISAAGAALLVDPYFKADMLEWLHSATQVTRLLLSAAKGQQAREVQLIGLVLDGMRENPNAGRIEIRATKSSELHDRCIVQEHGGVLLLGTSITGVGRHLSTIIPMPVTAATTMCQEIDKLWESAELVEPQKIRRESSMTD
jgi:hypothetical protein